MISPSTLLSCLTVALVWGVTNPLMARGASATTRARKFLGITLPFIANQLGSILFNKILSQGDIALCSPITNALTQVVTFVAGHAMGERYEDPKRAALGSALVLVGVGCCSYSSLGVGDGAIKTGNF